MGAFNAHGNVAAVVSTDDDLALQVEDEDSRRHHRGAREMRFDRVWPKPPAACLECRFCNGSEGRLNSRELSSLTPVAGLIFETKNRAIFLTGLNVFT